LNEARDDGILGWQWYQPDHMQTICTSLQTDNHTNTSSASFYRPGMLFQTPNQQCQSTEGKLQWHKCGVIVRALNSRLKGREFRVPTVPLSGDKHGQVVRITRASVTKQYISLPVKGR